MYCAQVIEFGVNIGPIFEQETDNLLIAFKEAASNAVPWVPLC
jgi:hypothetical protein